MPKPYVPNDKWSQKAAAEGYRARSVYKLMELDERFGLLKPGMRVLDIGASPGSWLQYASQRIGKSGKLIGTDLKPIDPIAENTVTYVCDVTDESAMESMLTKEGIGRFDLMLSDLAPSTSGMKDIDQWRSIELSQMVIKTAKKHLRPGAACVMKVLRGADFDEFYQELKRDWKRVTTFSAKASRDRSKEIYVIVSGLQRSAATQSLETEN